MAGFPTMTENMAYIFRSGTEEDFNELQQLLEDIYTFRHDQEELKQREKEKKKQKVDDDHQKALAMRSAALSGMASKLIIQSINQDCYFALF
jgi:hypothetical protein